MSEHFSAKHYANKSQKWAVGTMAECPNGSAKHWAQMAEETAASIGNPANRDLSNLTDVGVSRLSNLPLFISFKTGHILNNASYVNARLFSWLQGSVYTSAYQELVKEMTGNDSGEITTEYLYAFTYQGTTVYLKSETPVDGQKAYNVAGMELGNIVVSGDGFSINSPSHETSYKRDEAHDASLWINIAAEKKTQTTAGVTITYYLTITNKKICLPDQADNIAALYAATGAADFYLLDTENTRFKLPRRHARRLLRTYKNNDEWYNLYSDGWCMQGGITKTGTAINNNFTQTFLVKMADTHYYATGTYTAKTKTNAYLFAADELYGSRTQTSAVYRLDSEDNYWAIDANQYLTWFVQGYADTSLIGDEFEYEYYFLGNTVHNQTVIDVGQVAETFNTKADVDLSNAQPSENFKQQSARWAMPSSDYVCTSFVKTAIGTYTWTTPANGYFVVTGTCGLGNGSSVDLYCNNIVVDRISSVGHGFGLSWPCNKGDVLTVTVLVNALYNLNNQTFYYAGGEI